MPSAPPRKNFLSLEREIVLLLRLTRFDSDPLDVHKISIDPQPRHGFTLIEMLVVIVIIAMVLAFLIPALSPSSGRALVWRASHQFTRWIWKMLD